MSNNFNADHYTVKGSVPGHATDSEDLRHFNVLSHNPSKLHSYGADSTPEHALVVLQQGSGRNAKAVASFTPKQAQQLADALHAAAWPHEMC